MSAGNETAQEAIRLSLAERGESPPGLSESLVGDLREALPGILSDLAKSGSRWTRGKSAQEVAKAQEILSQVVDRIERLAMDNEEQNHRHRIEGERHDAEMQRERVELYLSAIERTVVIVQQLIAMGIDVNIEAMIGAIPVPAMMKAPVPNPKILE